MATSTTPQAHRERETTPDITLNVLGYHEEEEWVALALEMDLRGFGATFEEALAELRDLIATQISFALFKAQPEMIWKPAEGVWFGLYEQIRRQRLDAAIQARPFVDTAYQATGLPIPPAHVIAGFKADYLETDG